MEENLSAWERYPGYEINLLPCDSVARVSYKNKIVAESAASLLVKESEHDARLYLPEDDVNWENFQVSDHQSNCPFKGDASYWSLKLEDEIQENVAWTYKEPVSKVAGLKGYVSFDMQALKVELIQKWGEEGDEPITTRFPTWGDAKDLLASLDVQPIGENLFQSDPYPNPPVGTIIEELKERRKRSVVEGGHQLAQAVVAASKAVPNQRVTSASMIFSKAASFDAPLDLRVNVLRGGRSFSCLDVQTVQADSMRSAAIVLMDASDKDRLKHACEMPKVPGPYESTLRDWNVSGREIRVVDNAYTADLDHMGPPELHAWIRFRDNPEEQYQHKALMTQAITHWTIAAAMRPHPGISQALAHVSLSTGPLKADINFHDDVDVSQWMLYVNDAVYAGKGHAQGSGKIFSIKGDLLATYSIHAMIRDFPASAKGGRNAM